MKQVFVIFGPWELRHQEAASLLNPKIAWLPLRNVDSKTRTIVLQGSDLGETGPLDPEQMPLAIAVQDVSGSVVLSHLLHVLDNDRAMFFAVNHTVPAGTGIETAIAQAFDEWYLPLSNNECFYTYTTSKHRHLPVSDNVEMSLTARHFAQHLHAGDMSPFVPRFRFPVRQSFDVVSAFVFTDSPADDEYALLYGASVDTDDPSERQRPYTLALFSRHGRSELLKGQMSVTLGSKDGAQVVEDAFHRPCKLHRVWRRITNDVPLESAVSGAVYTVNFEHRIFMDAPSESHVTVRYEKTRGPADDAATERELDRLFERVEAFLIEKAATSQSAQAPDLPARNIKVIA
ncbi:hypothetical protein [Roseobacter weihaiensis]|uniref:hypothetical protein n=1 Tax=Roseobacter weihaiensis TaxID=2763262 RepID=UPI001D0BB87E|nr:hypothetical protein [Roseobacter sp. H9]